MKTVSSILVLIVAMALVPAAFAADAQKGALSWQKQARDTRAAVVEVATELGKLDASAKPDAQGLVADATRWLAEGDKLLAKADEEIASEDYQAASQDYNMAWQYYVKAATAGLNARRMLTGE